MCAVWVIETDVFDEGDLSEHIAIFVSFVWTAIGKCNRQMITGAK